MTGDHFVVLGVARARAPWLAEVGRWATSSALPIEFIRCVSVDEVRARLLSDRRHSAVLLDERAGGVDRDLVLTAHDARCAPIVVCSSSPLRDWIELGAAAVLAEPLTIDAILHAVREHAHEVERDVDPARDASRDGRRVARLVTVTGSGGTGTSTMAMAIAGHLSTRHDVALIDGALDADLALLHDLGDVLPGLPELVEAHRTSTPQPGDVRAALWAAPNHHYDVLPGLRRHRDWATMRKRNVEAAIHSVRSTYGLVVADTDLDVEGESDTGSLDVEDRNVLSRELLRNADVVVMTSRAGVAGIRRLLSGLALLVDHGIDSRRVVPVVIGAPRGTARRSELTRAITRLFDESRPGHAIVTPVMVPIRRDLEPFLRDAGPLPPSASGSVSAAVELVLGSVQPLEPTVQMPARIVPGRLGRTA